MQSLFVGGSEVCFSGSCGVEGSSPFLFFRNGMADIASGFLLTLGGVHRLAGRNSGGNSAEKAAGLCRWY